MGFFSVLTKNPPSGPLVFFTSLELINTGRYREKLRHADKETPAPGIQETDQVDKCAHTYRYIQTGPSIHASVGVRADTQTRTYPRECSGCRNSHSDQLLGIRGFPLPVRQ